MSAIKSESRVSEVREEAEVSEDKINKNSPEFIKGEFLFEG